MTTEVAEVYDAATAVGYPPRKAVAEFFGTSADVAAKLIQRARREGLLPRTERGRKAANVQTSCPTCGATPRRQRR